MINILGKILRWLLGHFATLVFILIMLSFTTWVVKPLVEYWPQIAVAHSPEDRIERIDSDGLEQLESILGEQQHKRDSLELQLSVLESELDSLQFYEIETKLKRELELVRTDRELQLTLAIIEQLEKMIAFRSADACLQRCDSLTKQCISAIRKAGATCLAVPHQCNTLERYVGPWPRICRDAKNSCSVLERSSEDICTQKTSVCQRCQTIEDPGSELLGTIQSQRGELLSLMIDVRAFIAGEIKTGLLKSLGVLASIILAPLLINTIAYFAVAPLGVSLFRLRLSTDDASYNEKTILDSKVTLPIELSETDRVLIRPDYVKAVPSNAAMCTRWLLNRSIPMTSLSTGLFPVTEVRGEGILQVGIVNPVGFEKLVTIRLTEGHQLTLHSRFIVGVIEHSDQQLKIRKVWKFFSPSAWLTLRLRHLLFSGDVTLILRGNQGIDLIPVHQSCALTVTDYVGYSANLRHSVERSDTFIAFHLNKQELFKHRFEEGVGYVLQESRAIRTDVNASGWSLRRVIDALLKSVGL